MAIFRKKSGSGVPDLPPLPTPTHIRNEQSLPSLPENFNEDFNRSVIKSAVDEGFDRNTDEESGIPSFPRGGLNEEQFLPNPKKEPMEIEQRIENKGSIRYKVKTIEGPESVFVRIDKFRSAKNEIAIAKQNLEEVEEILARLKDLKSREDEGVSSIDANVDDIKKKIDSLESLIFNKI